MAVVVVGGAVTSASGMGDSHSLPSSNESLKRDFTTRSGVLGGVGVVVAACPREGEDFHWILSPPGTAATEGFEILEVDSWEEERGVVKLPPLFSLVAVGPGDSTEALELPLRWWVVVVGVSELWRREERRLL